MTIRADYWVTFPLLYHLISSRIGFRKLKIVTKNNLCIMKRSETLYLALRLTVVAQLRQVHNSGKEISLTV